MQTLDANKPLLGPDECIPDGLWTVLNATVHPVAPLPGVEWLREHSLGELLQFLQDREETIERMKADPFRYGYESPIWKVLDALCGFPWADPTDAMIAGEPSAERRAEMRRQREWSLKVRMTLLKRPDRVRVLLINGGNRAGKSEWAASRVMKLLSYLAASRAWVLHQTAVMSRDYHQSLLYRYLPAELRTEKGIRKNPTYIAYKQQTGFSEEKFVLPNSSDCVFKYYEQDIKTIEGGELNVIWCDELVPASWIETLKARIATRGGWLLITFTPVLGYTPTVKLFIEVAAVVRKAIAYVLPKDGKEARVDLALAGDDADLWIEGSPSQPAIPDGREFEEVPRIMRGNQNNTAVAFLYSWDNPFGNPRELWDLYSSSPVSTKRMRFYGVANKTMSSQFPKFTALGVAGEPVHVVPADRIPKKGTRYHIVDPCSGRNWAMIWALVDRAPVGIRIWIYREWPCSGMYVPGVGDLGPWAIPGDKHDGERGPAQRKIGWGLIRYRNEMYRLEGRRDWDVADVEPEKPFQFDKDDEPEPMLAYSRRRGPELGEDIYERRMDSRYGASPTVSREGQTTLLEECGKIGLDFQPASGREIEEGTDLINSLLEYDAERTVSVDNSPRLFVSEECTNTIFALQNWTGADGQHGACKDFVDLLRYLVLADPDDHASTAHTPHGN
jgi:phage terminase large subunit-like protein